MILRPRRGPITMGCREILLQTQNDTTMTASFKAQSNRRNAPSTGPRTDQGESRSRFSALFHGITATFTVLPNENANAYDARLHGFMTDFQPRSAFEHYLIERAVKESWLSDRAMRTIPRIWPIT